ncbi:MAG: tetratricopeptide repeat protein [Nitrospinae bacterium]|nr:tetratricopeptide repeat protein [Nitrospinota bacterium]
MDFKVGDRIGGRYEVHRICGGAGRSGMGIVYVCFDHKGGGAVALKTYQQGFFHDKALFESFKRGALAWIHLDRHPYIVQAMGVFNIADRLYIGLEYIAPDSEGRNTLTHHLKGRIPPEKILRWGVQFCDGMEHARLKQITPHRDIKPDNLMITSAGNLKVSDFDLAGLGSLSAQPFPAGNVSSSAPGLSFIKAGEGKFVVGTPPWMAPEQFDGETDARSDIYSFGVTLYQMSAQGRLPVTAVDGDWAKAHRDQSPERLKTLLWPLIERCLAKDPAQRFGGREPEKGFIELRLAFADMWEREMRNMPVPSPPEGRVFQAGDHSDKGVSLAQMGMHDHALREYKKALELDPNCVLAYLNAGISLWRKKNYTEAAKAYIKAVKLDPNLAEGYCNYGQALKSMGNAVEAEKAFRKAIKLKPGLSSAYEGLGIILSESGRGPEAVALLAQALEKDTSNPSHHYNLGVCHERAGRFDEALKLFEKAVELSPDNAGYLYGLGNGYRFKGDMARAVEMWLRAAEIDPKHALVRYNLGIAYERAGNIEAGFQWYRQAIALDPQFADPYYNYALILANQNLYGDSAGAFENFAKYALPAMAEHVEKARGYIPQLKKSEADYLELMKTGPGALYNRGIAYMNLGLLVPAREHIDKALKMRPGYPNALCGLGILHERNGDYNAAADCYWQSLTSDPSYVIAWNNYGWANYNLGALKKAREAYERYIKSAPAEQAEWIAAAKAVLAEIEQKMGGGPAPSGGDFVDQFNKGMAFIKAMEYGKAAEAFWKAHRLKPSDSGTRFNLGHVLLMDGQYAEALNVFGALAAEMPGDVEVRYKVGMAKMKLNMLEEAVVEFRGAIKIDPKFGSTYYSLGWTLDTLGRAREACEAYRVFLANAGPNDARNVEPVRQRLEYLEKGLK